MYPLHPITGDYADFTEPEITTFRESLRNHGLVVPIVIWHDQIVDGRHRARLCNELGIELRVTDITKQYPTEEDMVTCVRALNEHRRANTKPLTNAEKRARIEAALKARPELSNRQIAEKVGASHPKVAEVRKQMEATGKITSSESTIGKDGKSRKPPAPKSRPSAPAPKPRPLVEPSHDIAQSAPEHSQAIAADSEPLSSRDASAAVPAPAAPQDPPANLVSDTDSVAVTRKQVDGIVCELEAVAKRLADIDSTMVVAATSVDQRHAYASRLRGVSQIVHEWVSDLELPADTGQLSECTGAEEAPTEDAPAIVPAVEGETTAATPAAPASGTTDDGLSIPEFLRRTKMPAPVAE